MPSEIRKMFFSMCDCGNKTNKYCQKCVVFDIALISLARVIRKEKKKGITWNHGKPSPTDRNKIIYNKAIDHVADLFEKGK